MAVRHYARGDTDKTVVHETRGAPYAQSLSH